MVNVTTEVKGNILVISVDLSKENGLSGSGKNMIIGSTQGNQTVKGPNGDVKLGVNVYKAAK